MEYYNAKDILVYKSITTTADVLQHLIGDLYAVGVEIRRPTDEEFQHYLDIQKQK